MPVAVIILACVVAALASIASAGIVARQNRRLTRQNTRISDHLERLTFAFVAQIPDALSGTVIYDKIGQQIGVQRLVVNLYDRVMNDPQLRTFFVGVDMDRLRSHQVSMYQALFGIEPYDGLDLTMVHADLGIRDEHFDLLMGHVDATLTSFGLSDSDIATVAGWLEAQRTGIVGA